MKANKIVIHHSVTPRDLDLMKSVKSFDQNHKDRIWSPLSKLWRHVTYHFVIWWNGDHIQCRDIDEAWRHASNMTVNNSSIAICMTGNFDQEEPTEAQLLKLKKIVEYVQWELGPMTIHFHREFAAKSCPWKNITSEMIQNTLQTQEHDFWYYSQLFQAVFKWQNITFKSPEDAVTRLLQTLEAKWMKEFVQELVALIAILHTKHDQKDNSQQFWSEIIIHDIPDSCDCNNIIW